MPPSFGRALIGAPFVRSGIDIDEIDRARFTRQKTGMRYSDMQEPGLIYRCLGILLNPLP